MGDLPARLGHWWRVLTRAERLDAAMDDEMRFHIEMEADRLVHQQGLTPAEARRQAAVAFGGLEKYKEAGRDVRGLGWLDALSLDLRLGIRMLVKYRGLTLVGGFAMAVAIAIGGTAFEVFGQILDRSLPFDEGDRIVALRFATSTPGSAEQRVVEEFATLRRELTSVEHLSAFRTAQHNLVIAGSSSEPVKVAEMSPSGFTVVRTPPLLGRHLLPEDEQGGAATVLVIGYDAWQTRFAGDPLVVGRPVTLGGQPATIVGVMPQGFRFPIDHQYWTALRAPTATARLQGPEISMFGRLVDGVSMGSAQMELTAFGERLAAAYPATHSHLRPVLLPFTHEHLDVTDPFRVWLLRLAQLFVGIVTFVVAVNLAILVYARTVTRAGEIAVRTALGATRRRILLQLFVEAFALTASGAGAGLLLSHAALVRLESMARINGAVPFWITFELSASTIAYALALAFVAAVVMGVVPGLKATSSRVHANLRELDSRSGITLGPLWTMLVVGQVAVAVAVLPLAVLMTWRVVRMGAAGPEFDADRFMVALVAAGDAVAPADGPLFKQRHDELVARLEAEPGVAAVSFSSGVPGFAPGRLLRFDEQPASAGGPPPVKYVGMDLGVDTLDVGLDIFETYQARFLAGRPLGPADVGQANAVVVNTAFLREFLNEGSSAASALGVRFRYVAPYERRGSRPDTSYEIVGVVDDFPRFPHEPGSHGDATIYHPAGAGDVHPVVLSVRFSHAGPAGFADRFRTIGAEVDPALQLRRVAPLADYYYQARSFWRYLAWGIGLVTVSVLLLSAAGMYALMSFTVAQRTREIAVRAALGADPRRLLLTIFGRVTRQLGTGLALGALLAAVIFQSADVGVSQGATLVLVVASLLTVVGLLAALGPARRGLRIHPSDALRAGG